jgi:hypothetical protein
MTISEVDSVTKTPSDVVMSPTSSKTNPEKDRVRLQWNEQTEKLLQSWGDIASCYSWMHDKSFREYQQKNFKFSLPVIVLSTLTGTLNLALQGYVPPEYITYAQAGIGSVNIFTGILTTLQNYFRYAENSESHRNASVGWGKLQRNISIELTYDRTFRKDADSFIRGCRMDYDRLLEQSPMIPAHVIKLFKQTYDEELIKNPKDKTKLVMPDVCGDLTHTNVYEDSINEHSQFDNILGVKNNGEPKILPEIKDMLLDRLNDLENNMMTKKNIEEYTIDELKVALERKRSNTNFFNPIHEHEKRIEEIVKKSIDPIKLNVRRMSENYIKPDLKREPAIYNKEIDVNKNNVKNLIKSFQQKFDPDNVVNKPTTQAKEVNEQFNTPLNIPENKKPSISVKPLEQKTPVNIEKVPEQKTPVNIELSKEEEKELEKSIDHIKMEYVDSPNIKIENSKKISQSSLTSFLPIQKQEEKEDSMIEISLDIKDDQEESLKIDFIDTDEDEDEKQK